MPCPVTVREFWTARLLPRVVVELQRRRVRYVIPSGDVGETVGGVPNLPLASCLLQPCAASEPGEFPYSES